MTPNESKEELTIRLQHFADTYIAARNDSDVERMQLALDNIHKYIQAHTTKALLKELEQLELNLPGDTDCAEFYTGGVHDGCEPEEHARRSARFFYSMDVEDLLNARIKELKATQLSKGEV